MYKNYKTCFCSSSCLGGGEKTEGEELGRGGGGGRGGEADGGGGG